MFCIVFDERALKYCVVLRSVAKAHDWLTVIGESYSTYRQAENALKGMKNDE